MKTQEKCASCGDYLSDKPDNLAATWSDRHDNVTCWWCATRNSEIGDSSITQRYEIIEESFDVKMFGIYDCVSGEVLEWYPSRSLADEFRCVSDERSNNE